jgi:hypothetical protein
MLGQNQTLRTLVAKKNALGNEGCHQILVALKDNRSLHTLNLSDCGLTTLVNS